MPTERGKRNKSKGRPVVSLRCICEEIGRFEMAVYSQFLMKILKVLKVLTESPSPGAWRKLLSARKAPGKGWIGLWYRAMVAVVV